MLRKPLHLFFLIIVLVLFFILQFFSLRQHTQSFYFGDETEHLTLAWMMVKQGKELYTDLSTVHQPLVFYTSMVFLRSIAYENLYMFIERLRQFMIAFSLLGALLITLRFREKGLITSFLVETVKFYFFGYHMLAESLTVYPIIWVVGVLFERYIIIPRSVDHGKILDDVMFGGSIFWIAFNYFPSLPFLFLAFLLYVTHQRRVVMLRVAASALLPTMVLFMQIDLLAWYQETIANAVKYIVPFESQITSLTAKLSLMFYPLLSFSQLKIVVGRYFVGLTVMGLVGCYQMLKSERNRRKVALILISIYVLVILLNLRVPYSNIAFYSAFHVLPMAAGFTMLILSIVTRAISATTPPTRRIITIGFACLTIVLLVSSTEWWRERKDKLNDHYIQYGEVESIGNALMILKLPGDTLLVGNNDGYMNIVADLPLAARQNAHLPWAWRSPRLRQEFVTLMQKETPTFVYFPESTNPYYLYIKPILEREYIRLRRGDGATTSAYILKTVVHRYSSEQRMNLEKLYYILPQID